MDFGMPTLIENKNLEENVALCKELDLKFIELNMNLPEYQIEKLEEVSYFKEIAQRAGIYFTIHLFLTFLSKKERNFSLKSLSEVHFIVFSPVLPVL